MNQVNSQKIKRTDNHHLQIYKWNYYIKIN